MTMWMIRPGVDRVLLEPFLSIGMVAVGWPDIGDLSEVRSWEGLTNKFEMHYPRSPHQAGVLYRFANEICIGDIVLTVDIERRVYSFGCIAGRYKYFGQLSSTYPHVRKVMWLGIDIPRDDLLERTKRSIGGPLTMVRLSESAENDVVRVANNLNVNEI